MDLFKQKNIEPMLIAQMQEPFNDPDWIYELKLDGSRCIAYLDAEETVLRNKRNENLLPKFPELAELHKNAGHRLILDGELIVLKNGVPDFYELQRRSLMSDRFKIKLASTRFPASYVAYDILYESGQELTGKPLMERKELLQKAVKESGRLAISRYISENGIGLYRVADQKELEGVVAKRKDSLYSMGKRSKDWIKFKRMADEEYIICGYIKKSGSLYSLVLGKYKEGRMSYIGHVTLGVSREVIASLKPGPCPFTEYPSGNDQAEWTVPDRVCLVEYMPNTKNSLRQAVFKGVRDDVYPEDVTV